MVICEPRMWIPRFKTCGRSPPRPLGCASKEVKRSIFPLSASRVVFASNCERDLHRADTSAGGLSASLIEVFTDGGP